jgi:hypothetical protein
MIVFKGEMIDNIEHNFLKTQEFIGKAVGEVYKAKESQEATIKVNNFI